jgi:hypothetical protein
MYASNEDEYKREDDDWVFLRQTSPENTVKCFGVLLFFEFYFIFIKDSSWICKSY